MYANQWKSYDSSIQLCPSSSPLRNSRFRGMVHMIQLSGHRAEAEAEVLIITIIERSY